MDGEPTAARQAQLATVARLYYQGRKTKTEIAEALGLSRFKIARMLDQALEVGIVTIRVHDPLPIEEELSERLRDHLGLREAIVVDVVGGDEAALRSRVAEAAARFLHQIVQPGEVLGMTWGRTLTAMSESLPGLPGVSIVQLTGCAGVNVADSPVEVVRKASINVGGPASAIFAPLIVDDAETAAALRRHPQVAEAFRLFDRVSTAVVAVGSWDPPVSQLREVMTPRDREDLAQRGVKAEVAATFVTDGGTVVGEEYAGRCIAISAAQLKRIPRVIAVASSAQKARAVRAVARAGLITDLVTDRRLADTLLNDLDRQPPVEGGRRPW